MSVLWTFPPIPNMTLNQRNVSKTEVKHPFITYHWFILFALWHTVTIKGWAMSTELAYVCMCDINYYFYFLHIWAHSQPVIAISIIKWLYPLIY